VLCWSSREEITHVQGKRNPSTERGHQRADRRKPQSQKTSQSDQDIDLDYHDIEWFALETNRDHSVIFEIASKYCVLDSFVDHDGYSISSKGFLPTVVDTMVI